MASEISRPEGADFIARPDSIPRPAGTSLDVQNTSLPTVQKHTEFDPSAPLLVKQNPLLEGQPVALPPFTTPQVSKDKHIAAMAKKDSEGEISARVPDKDVPIKEPIPQMLPEVAIEIFGIDVDTTPIPEGASRVWNDMNEEEKGIVRDRLVGGKSDRQIGEELGGVSKQTINQRYNRLVRKIREGAERVPGDTGEKAKTDLRALPPEIAEIIQRDVFVRSQTTDTTIADLAMEYNVSVATIGNWIRAEKDRRGIPLREGKGVPKDQDVTNRKDELRRALGAEEKINVNDYAARWKISAASVYKYLQEIRREGKEDK